MYNWRVEIKDYKSIIKYMEQALELMSGDKVDRAHAGVNLQFAIMDLKAIDRDQDKEINSITRDFIERSMRGRNDIPF